MWIEKLFGTALKGIPASVGMIPDHFRRQAMARLRNNNPFRYLPVRAELVRALRIAWVEAALPILDSARGLSMPNKKPVRGPRKKRTAREQSSASDSASPGRLSASRCHPLTVGQAAAAEASATNEPKMRRIRTSTSSDSDYLPASTVRELLRQGRPESERRLRAADMISVHQAALLVGESVPTVSRWIASRKCIGVRIPGQPMRLPIWQFADDLLLWISPIAQALQAKSGWQLLSFLESPHGGLSGRTPRQAIEQGEVERVLAVALD